MFDSLKQRIDKIINSSPTSGPKPPAPAAKPAPAPASAKPPAKPAAAPAKKGATAKAPAAGAAKGAKAPAPKPKPKPKIHATYEGKAKLLQNRIADGAVLFDGTWDPETCQPVFGEGTFTSGVVCHGTWKDECFIEGKKTNPDGTTYVGTFFPSKTQPLLKEGKIFRKNGELWFDGEFEIVANRHNIKKGKSVFENKSVFDGEYRTGYFLRGTLVSGNGVRSIGRFARASDGRQNMVEGRLIMADGAYFIGTCDAETGKCNIGAYVGKTLFQAGRWGDNANPDAGPSTSSTPATPSGSPIQGARAPATAAAASATAPPPPTGVNSTAKIIHGVKATPSGFFIEGTWRVNGLLRCGRFMSTASGMMREGVFATSSPMWLACGVERSRNALAKVRSIVPPGSAKVKLGSTGAKLNFPLPPFVWTITTTRTTPASGTQSAGTEVTIEVLEETERMERAYLRGETFFESEELESIVDLHRCEVIPIPVLGDEVGAAAAALGERDEFTNAPVSEALAIALRRRRAKRSRSSRAGSGGGAADASTSSHVDPNASTSSATASGGAAAVTVARTLLHPPGMPTATATVVSIELVRHDLLVAEALASRSLLQRLTQRASAAGAAGLTMQLPNVQWRFLDGCMESDAIPSSEAGVLDLVVESAIRRGPPKPSTIIVRLHPTPRRPFAVDVDLVSFPRTWQPVFDSSAAAGTAGLPEGSISYPAKRGRCAFSIMFSSPSREVAESPSASIGEQPAVAPAAAAADALAWASKVMEAYGVGKDGPAFDDDDGDENDTGAAAPSAAASENGSQLSDSASAILKRVGPRAYPIRRQFLSIVDVLHTPEHIVRFLRNNLHVASLEASEVVSFPRFDGLSRHEVIERARLIAHQNMCVAIVCPLGPHGDRHAASPAASMTTPTTATAATPPPPSTAASAATAAAMPPPPPPKPSPAKKVVITAADGVMQKVAAQRNNEAALEQQRRDEAAVEETLRVIEGLFEGLCTRLSKADARREMTSGDADKGLCNGSSSDEGDASSADISDTERVAAMDAAAAVSANASFVTREASSLSELEEHTPQKAGPHTRDRSGAAAAPAGGGGEDDVVANATVRQQARLLRTILSRVLRATAVAPEERKRDPLSCFVQVVFVGAGGGIAISELEALKFIANEQRIRPPPTWERPPSASAAPGLSVTPPASLTMRTANHVPKASASLTSPFDFGATAALLANLQDPAKLFSIRADGSLDSVLVDVREGTAEYRQVTTRFHDRFGQAAHPVTRVQRVQNFALWEKYVQKRRQVAKENDGDPNEISWLVHGTRATEPSLILSNGFDPRYSDQGFYGRASYFSFDSAYSHAYRHPIKVGSDDKTYGQLFLATVTCGRIDHRAEKDKTLRHPEPPCHTVQGPVTDGGLEAVMTYELNMAVPAYLITYRTPALATAPS